MEPNAPPATVGEARPTSIDLEGAWTPVIRLRGLGGHCEQPGCMRPTQYGAAFYVSGPPEMMTWMMLLDKHVLRKAYYCAEHRPYPHDPHFEPKGEPG